MARRSSSIPLGVDVTTGEPVSLGLSRLSEHLVCTGPTGVGKSRGLLLPLFEHLAPLPDVAVVAVTCKGDYADMCSDWAIAHGLTDKLIHFKPGSDPHIGFNPLKRNGWPAERHAKVARAALLASRGEHSLDEMPQLSRLLFLSLAVALEQGLSLVESVRLLRPGRSPFRSAMLRAVESEFLRESLAWFDSLKDPRQEELAASSVARLENFISDPVIRRILTEPDCCLDIHDVISNHKKLVIDCNFYSPLVPDDARMMLRLLLNSILAAKFATPKEERSLTVLLLDEAAQYSTLDLAAALELGRELKLAVVLAHQFPSQFKLSREDTRIFDAVQHCARTRIVFGGIHVDQLEGIVKDIMIEQFDPYAVKERVKTLIAEPTETTRTVVTDGATVGRSTSRSEGTSAAIARGRSRGTSRQWGASHAHSDGFSLVHSSGTTSGMSNGETLLPDGQILAVTSAADGASEIDTMGTSTVDSYGEFQAEGEQESTSETKTASTQSANALGRSKSYSRSSSTVPFHQVTKHWQWDTTYWQLDEFLTLCLQKFKAQPRGHFAIKVPNHKAVFVRANHIRVPWVSNALRERALARIALSLLRTPPNHLPVAPTAIPGPPILLETSCPPQPLRTAVELPHPHTRDQGDDPWQ